MATRRDMNRYYLDMTMTGIEVLKNKKKMGKPIKTKEELLKILIDNDYNEDIDVMMCSSSMDFPHEYTDDESLIALANTIRG